MRARTATGKNLSNLTEKRLDPDLRTTVVPLKKAASADLEEIYALNITSFSERWSRRSLANALDMEFDFRIHRLRGNQLAAYYLGQDVADEVHILQLAIATPFRRHGLARRIMQQILEEKSKVGMHRALLEVRADNRAAQDLYKALGFSLTGRRKAYYKPSGASTQREDALLLTRNL